MRRDDDDEHKHAVGHRRYWTDIVVRAKNEMRAESASREPRKKHAARLREAFPQLCNGRDKRLPSRQQERARCSSTKFFVWSTRVYTRAKLVELVNVSGSRKA